MPNVSINKSAFLSILNQFKGDVVFQRELIDTIMGNLPTNYKKTMLTELYYEHVYEGAYYRLSHMTYKSNIMYFTKVTDVQEFLKEWTASDRKYPYTAINKAIKNKKPLCGFYITKEEK